MEKENVIQKIQKLLKLQYNAEKIGSTGEAYQAAKMVRKLLMEYNLSMSDIDTSEETALVVCHQEAIEEYVNENYKWNESKPRHRRSAVYGDVYDMGCRDGREVSLNRQIDQTPKEGNLFQSV